MGLGSAWGWVQVRVRPKGLAGVVRVRVGGSLMFRMSPH